MSGFVPQAPGADDVTTPWWEATRDRRLVVQHCLRCGAYQHPPRAICSTCGQLGSFEFRASTGGGIVDSWTTVHRSPIPSTPLPYVIARVQIDEGPLLLTRLLGALDWAIGDRVVLDWLPMEDGRALPVFRQDVR